MNYDEWLTTEPEDIEVDEAALEEYLEQREDAKMERLMRDEYE